MLASPILYLKGMRVLMFQLSGFYYIPLNPRTGSVRVAKHRHPPELPGLLGGHSSKPWGDLDMALIFWDS